MSALLAMLIGLASALGAEQVTYGAARSSGRLDFSGVTSRDQAMGNASAAAGRGPSVFLVNPSLLAGQDAAYSLDQNLNLFFSRSLISASHVFKGYTGAAALGYADFGSLNGFDFDGTPYSVRPYQASLDLGAGKHLDAGFKAGLAAHSLIQSFGKFGAKSAFGASGGLNWERNGWNLAYSHDLESDLDRAANTILSSMKIGAAWSSGWLESQRLTLASQLDYDFGFSRIARVGIENFSFGILALRAGYEAPLGQEFGLPSWTTGLGVQYGEWQIDLCYAGRDALGATQRASLTWRPEIGTKKEPMAEAAPVQALPQTKPVPSMKVPKGKQK